MLVTGATTGGLVQAVRARRSVRYFSSRPVRREVVAELLEDACWAPSPHNSQPWRFTVLFAETDKSRLAEAMAARLVAEARAAGLAQDEARHQAERSINRICDAPVVVLCSLHADGLVRYGDERMDSLEWQMAVQSVGAVLQTLFLLASERGIGTCWMAAPMYCPDAVRNALRLAPDLSPQALVLLGYPERAGKRRPRRTVSDVVEMR